MAGLVPRKVSPSCELVLSVKPADLGEFTESVHSSAAWLLLCL